MGVVPPCSDDDARRDGLLAAPQQTRRVIHGPEAPARIVALHSDAHPIG
jgi:hypothetical protein